MEHSGTELASTQYGQGLIAKEPIPAGQFIASFDGEIYFWDWPQHKLAPDIFEHAVPFSDNYVRDSSGLARYLNHSCNPNCGIFNLFDLVTLRAIEPGEELVWDYDTAQDDEVWKMECRCGEDCCRGTVQGYGFLSEAQKETCRDYTSPWILAKHTALDAKRSTKPEAG